MSDAEHRKVAEKTLQTALDVVMRQRRDQHGSAEDSFQMIADQWSNYIKHAIGKRYGLTCSIQNVELTPADVAQFMVMLKICRSVYGDPAHPDHYVDQAGYSGLAAALSGVNVGAATSGPVESDDERFVSAVSDELNVRND